MMFRTTTALTALSLSLLVSPALAQSDVPTSQGVQERSAPPAPPLSISWLPDWLMTPISRAIADATDPRPRK